MNIKIRECNIENLEELLKWRMEVLHCVFKIPQRDSMEELLKANREYYISALKNKSHTAVLAEK